MKGWVVPVVLALVASACAGDQGDEAVGEPDDPVVATAPPDRPSCNELREAQIVVDGPVSSDADVAAQQELRASFGFASDEATVASVTGVDQASPSGELEGLRLQLLHGLGLVLTPEEVRDFSDRQSGPAFDAALRAVRAFEDAHADTHAGTWIDQAGGVLKVAVTGDLEAQWAELEPTLPDGHQVVMVAAEHSRA